MGRKYKGSGTKPPLQCAEPPADYTAAVRYHDGSSELVHVRNAIDHSEARTMVFDQLMNIRSVVIATRQRV